jgi:hypothetical protein
MSDKLKITLGIIGGVVGAILVFCLIVVIGCSVNGLTFGQQVCQWFGGNSSTAEAVEEIADVVAETPLA